MDKFGIFNLLNSFLNYYGEEKSKSEKENLTVDKEKTPTSSDSVAPLRATETPLQASMLGTIKTHDEFIKRVMEKNKS